VLVGFVELQLLGLRTRRPRAELVIDEALAQRFDQRRPRARQIVLFARIRREVEELVRRRPVAMSLSFPTKTAFVSRSECISASSDSVAIGGLLPLEHRHEAFSLDARRRREPDEVGERRQEIERAHERVFTRCALM
jgi:hypothetical protein